MICIRGLPNVFRVLISGQTWERDSYGLFDYECNKVVRAALKAGNSGVLVRIRNPFSRFFTDLARKRTRVLRPVGAIQEQVSIVGAEGQQRPLRAVLLRLLS